MTVTSITRRLKPSPEHGTSRGLYSILLGLYLLRIFTRQPMYKRTREKKGRWRRLGMQNSMHLLLAQACLAWLCAAGSRAVGKVGCSMEFSEGENTDEKGRGYNGCGQLAAMCLLLLSPLFIYLFEFTSIASAGGRSPVRPSRELPGSCVPGVSLQRMNLRRTASQVDFQRIIINIVTAAMNSATNR